jgi:hypothetical protein
LQDAAVLAADILISPMPPEMAGYLLTSGFFKGNCLRYLRIKHCVKFIFIRIVGNGYNEGLFIRREGRGEVGRHLGGSDSNRL